MRRPRCAEEPGHLVMGKERALPYRAGVGLKADHYDQVLAEKPDIGWFEVHAENYMGAGGPPHHYLERIRRDYPLSVHGVGLSIGGDGPLDRAHLQRLERVINRYDPESFSEHLAWSTHSGMFFNDLLPLPYTRETLARVIEHVDQVQNTLGRRMLLENPATYVTFDTGTMSETDFLEQVSRRTGCGLLLDVNNLYVSATNHDYSAAAYIAAFPVEAVGEIHLAGHARDADETGHDLLIDAHDRAVADAVWDLYRTTIVRTGPVPTLIEWDNDVPEWPVLFGQARAAERMLGGHAAESIHAVLG
ncbi:MAG: DUF692 domain-containing protein [Arenicellales bacterium]